MTTFLHDKLIWILEDELSCQFVYSEAFEIRYELRFFHTVADFRQALIAGGRRPDMIISDLKLPGETFLSFLAKEEDAELIDGIPFIIVSSIDDIDVLKKCFEEGALDYLTKPFGKNELIVKTERILGNNHAVAELVAVDSMTMIAKNRIGRIRLTPKEMQILSVLRSAKGKPVTREMIIKQVWETTEVGKKTLDVHLFNLRRKTRGLGLKIEFVPPCNLRLLDGRQEADSNTNG